MKALIVDDNAFARQVALRVLNSSGVTAVLAASGGQEAIEILKQPGTNVDIVFCDLIMPDMDGLQFVRHVATLSRRPSFVFVSGADLALLNTAMETARARGLDVLETIEKPIKQARVLEILQRFKMTQGRSGPSEVATAKIVTSQDLENALASGQFVLHYQPKVGVTNRAVAGFESLARWQHPEQGIIPPGAFIGMAEQEGLISDITYHLITLAMKQCAAWAKVGLDTKISVNLSAYMLVELDLPDRLFSHATEVGIDPSQIVLEVTESGAFKDIANTLDILARLHMKGFALSIDDFGTGYSSLDQLRRIPFTEMKIDRAFVHGVARNAKMEAILKHSVAMARGLNLTIVAEGAETQEDWNMLEKHDVNLVQGYLVAKPMPAEQVKTWIASWAKKDTVLPP